MKHASKFAAFILTHGRPDNCVTYESLRRHGYTGKIYLIVDNLDKTQNRYLEKYGDEVIIFDKEECAKTIDKGDNLPGLGTAMFARNASFDIARDLGLTNFVQLDDDYTDFGYRFDDKYQYNFMGTKCLDRVFDAFVDFLRATPTSSISMAQGGDFIGGSENQAAQKIFLHRKCMNSWFCDVGRQFPFSMRMNDDVTTYILLGSRGKLFFTSYQTSLNQVPTQAAAGGMSELYAESGTYQKTFYSVMACPSFVKVSMIRGQSNSRIHHRVSWKNATPFILREEVRK